MATIQDRRRKLDKATGRQVATGWNGSKPFRVIYRDPTGKQRSKSFARKTDAKRFKTAVESELITGTFTDVDLGRMTFDDWADRYLAQLIRKPSTVASYHSVINKHLRPRFGHRRINSLTRDDVKQLIADMHHDGKKRQTIKNATTQLAAVLETALDAGAVRANVAARPKLPKDEAKPEKVFLTPDEIELLAQTITPHYAMLVRFAGHTGVRAGEAEALKVGDVRPDLGCVEVRNNVAEVHGKLTIGLPKNGKARTVYIGASMAAELAVFCAGRDADEWLFTTESGAQIRHGNFFKRHFKPAVLAAGLEPATNFHTLRHSAASIMLATNLPLLAVSQQLGHSSIDVTVDTYGHLMPSTAIEVRQALDAAWT